MTDNLGSLVRDKWSSLLLRDFEVREEDSGRVVLVSAAAQVVVVHDARGELDVFVRPRGRDWPYEWAYVGMVGKASVGRRMELALSKMLEEPAILGAGRRFLRAAETWERGKFPRMDCPLRRPRPPT